MSNLNLPQSLQQQLQQQAGIKTLRLQLASAVYPQLVAIDYEIARAIAHREADPLGTGEGDGIPDSGLRINLGLPASIALHAADALLAAAGLIAPPVVSEGGS